jgi:ABC-type transport system involved in cytochrome bd biosynthesis fused ATPase/permease subunit
MMNFSMIFTIFKGLSLRVKWAWGVVFFLGVVSALLELLVSLTFGVLISSALNTIGNSELITFGNYSFSISFLLRVFILLILFRIAITIVESSIKAKVTSQSILDYSGKFLKILLNDPGNSNKSSSQLQVDIVDSTNHTFRWSFLGLANVFSFSLMIFFLTILSIIVEPVYGLSIFLIFSILLLPIVYFINRDLVKLHDKLQSASNKIYNLVKQTIELKREIILYKRVQVFTEYFSVIRVEKANLEAKAISKSVLPKLAVETTFFVSVALFVYTTISSDKAFEIDQNLLTFIFCLFRILPLIGQLSSNYTQFKSGIPSVNSLFQLANKVDNIQSKPTQEILSFKNSIELESVTFSYPNTKVGVLANVSLRINRGDKVAIIGESGSGKSTLLDILLGLQIPDNGRVIVDGITTNPGTLRWAPRVGYVSQSFANFDIDIQQAIRFDFSNKPIETEVLNKILTDVGLSFTREENEREFIENDNFISRLSGGQAQRVAIARALFFEGDLIVLDEATSNLDAETSRQLLDKFMSSDKTVILVTHRSEDLKGFEKVYCIIDGNISSTIVSEGNLTL